ncbi:MAG: hypothetical protein HY421_00165 [Candidatus Kerfeldbacteria bacterium]|nr:hypothetical protein [Candidatus Kerfeldbacteria bacterium]
MKWKLVVMLALLSAMPGLTAADFSARVQRGTIVLGGNEITNFDLTVHNGRVMINDLQAYPSPLANGKRLDAESVSTLAEQQHSLNTMVRAAAVGQRKQGVPESQIASRARDAFANAKTLVDTTWINRTSGMLWVKWKDGFAEEVDLSEDLPSAQPSPTVPEIVARCWLEALDAGGTVYVGEGYDQGHLVWPKQLPTFRDQLRRATSSNQVEREQVSLVFVRKYGPIIRDLRSKRPLDAFRVRR